MIAYAAILLAAAGGIVGAVIMQSTYRPRPGARDPEVKGPANPVSTHQLRHAIRGGGMNAASLNPSFSRPNEETWANGLPDPVDAQRSGMWGNEFRNIEEQYPEEAGEIDRRNQVGNSASVRLSSLHYARQGAPDERQALSTPGAQPHLGRPVSIADLNEYKARQQLWN